MDENAVKKIHLKAEGITCSGCAVDMETVLRNADGIMDAKVDYASGLININFDPRELRVDQVVSMVEKLGVKTKQVDPGKQ